MFELIPAEKELLLRVALGDEHAFSALFAMYHQVLASHIYRVTECMELTEEVVQDSFLKIWLNRESLPNVLSFKAYLFVISKNHALNCLRKLAKERSCQKSLEQDAPILTLDAQNEDNRYYNLLDKAIDRLPPQQQKVYLLSRHKRLKYDEIANQMGLSRETVKKYLQSSTISITNFVQSHNDIALLLLGFLIFF